MRLYGNSDRVGIMDYGSTIYVGGAGGSDTPLVEVYNGLDSQSSEMALSAYMGLLLNSKVVNLQNQFNQISGSLITPEERQTLSMFHYDQETDTISVNASFAASGEVSAYRQSGGQSEYARISQSEWNSLLSRVTALENSAG